MSQYEDALKKMGGADPQTHGQILIPIKFIPVDVGIADLVQFMNRQGFTTEYSCQGRGPDDSPDYGLELPFVLFHCEIPEMVKELTGMLDGFAKMESPGTSTHRLEFFSVEKLREFNMKYFAQGLWYQVKFSAH